MKTVAIIDYGSGNLRSAANAFEHAIRNDGLDATVVVTSDPAAVRIADRIVLPGVGAFADCRAGLDALSNMVGALNDRVLRDAVPFLGICVGQQLMAERGLEKGTTPGLGWIEGDVVEINPGPLKLPQIGWNTIDVVKPHPILDGIETGPTGMHAYFVHSFHLRASAAAIATTSYGEAVTAIVGQDNMVGTQFHPEKSQRMGLALIGNFLRWNPS